jgi:hypothetical protein
MAPAEALRTSAGQPIPQHQRHEIFEGGSRAVDYIERELGGDQIAWLVTCLPSSSPRRARAAQPQSVAPTRIRTTARLA